MVYINKTKGVSSAQGVPRRPLKRTICQSNTSNFFHIIDEFKKDKQSINKTHREIDM